MFPMFCSLPYLLLPSIFDFVADKLDEEEAESHARIKRR